MLGQPFGENESFPRGLRARSFAHRCKRSAQEISPGVRRLPGQRDVTDMTTAPAAAGTPGAARTRRVIDDKPSGADRLFDMTTLAAGVTVLVLLTLVGVFLLWQGRHAWAYAGWHFFTTTA